MKQQILYLVGSMGVSIMTGCIFYFYFKRRVAVIVDQQVKKERFVARQNEAQFKTLASSINPHFLNNTLETIRMRAMFSKQHEIEDMTKMLAKVLRGNIETSKEIVPLSSELNLVESYLKLQEYRFGDRIHYEINRECDLEHTNILSLLIQPVVENAYIHGLEEKEGNQNYIRLTVRKEDMLKIIVEDNGVGIGQDRLQSIRKQLKEDSFSENAHSNLCNINQRIKLLYGDQYGVTLESKQGEGTTVVIAVPLEQKLSDGPILSE
ncbi:MAG: histidine kinase [bacterium]|nr:histidine kinase [bacterium]